MPPAVSVLSQLVDPRGRSGRREFLVASITLLGLQVTGVALLAPFGAEAEPASLVPVNVLCLWIFGTAVARRLHDVGRSAWWLPGGILLWLAAGLLLAAVLALGLGPNALKPGKPAFWLVFLLVLPVPMGAALWLHTAEGERGRNRFGPAPVLGGGVLAAA